MTLYDDLDIPPDADSATIKAAHRRAVKKHHPDKPEGDRDAFERVQRAFIVLSDPDRRAKYDRDGDAEEKPDNLAAQALKIAIMAFIGAVNAAARDPVREANVRIDDQLNQAELGARASEAEAERMIKAKARLNYRGKGDDFLGTMLNKKIADAKANAARIRDEMNILVEAQKRLASYHFDSSGMEDCGPQHDDLARMIELMGRPRNLRPGWQYK
jgi:curved DNA-binding protein CbpA